MRIARMMRANLTRLASAPRNWMLAIEKVADEEIWQETIVRISPDVHMYVKSVLIAIERRDGDGDAVMSLRLCHGNDAD